MKRRFKAKIIGGNTPSPTPSKSGKIIEMPDTEIGIISSKFVVLTVDKP